MTAKHWDQSNNPVLIAKNLIDIALALSTQRDINRLLEMIVSEALRISCADAGSLYIINEEGTELDFAIFQNLSLDIKLGGEKDEPINLPSVPIHTKDNEPNYANISSYAALTGEIINIKDVYTTTKFNFTGFKRYDEETGYRSTSMLVIPMYDYENEILGVIQLLNALDPDTKEVVPFDKDLTDIVSALASLAAMALTNRQLLSDLQQLFYAFIKSIASAIDAKSHHTSSHINRVVELTMMIAREINDQEKGPFADVQFTPDDLEELKIAAWMHDIGKIITPECVINKRTKLEAIGDRIETIKLKFELIAMNIENQFLLKKADLIRNGEDERGSAILNLQEGVARQKEQLESDLAFICECNDTKKFMDDKSLSRLQQISRQTFPLDGKPCPYVTEEELEKLSIKKGNLTQEERKVIEEHVIVSKKILQELPFPKKLNQVPEIAGSHHEKLNGLGYPDGKTKEEIGLQTRIMTVADIFEALTAADRPYKLPIPLSKALAILGFMVKDNELDKDILDLFNDHRLFDQYAKEHLEPEQIDT